MSNNLDEVINVTVLKFDGAKARNSFKGNFDCIIEIISKVSLPVIFEIKECSFFDDGKKKFVLPPSKWKRMVDGKFERDFFYFAPKEDFRDLFSGKTINAVERYIEKTVANNERHTESYQDELPF